MSNIFVTCNKGPIYTIFYTEGTLYKRGKPQKRKVVHDKEEANQIFRECHASTFGAHCGVTKTRDAVCKWFYWPGMTTDIDKWVSTFFDSSKEKNDYANKSMVQFFTTVPKEQHAYD